MSVWAIPFHVHNLDLALLANKQSSNKFIYIKHERTSHEGKGVTQHVRQEREHRHRKKEKGDRPKERDSENEPTTSMGQQKRQTNNLCNEAIAITRKLAKTRTK